MLIFIFSCERKQNFQSFHTIEVDKEERTIVFSANLNLSETEKYFLFYFEGYPWLKQHCIFISSSTLKELQTAISNIDWQLWDKIYIQKFSPNLKIEIFHNNQWEDLENFILTKNFDTYQTIFWGDKTYDEIILEKDYKVRACATCKFLPLEKDIILADKKIINYEFIKKLQTEDLKFRIKF